MSNCGMGPSCLAHSLARERNRFAANSPLRDDRSVSDEQSTDGRAGITAALVSRLVAGQFPQWAHLPVTPVEVDGWDNRTYRLGARLTVRLPTHASYVAAIDKEDRWLPVLAPRLPVPIPTPLATGVPGAGYPFRWSVRRWLPGETARRDRVRSPGFAKSIAEFILALHQVEPSDGPPAGAHSFYRGAPLAHYDAETHRALTALDGVIDVDRAAAVWAAALDATWEGPAVWFHGDIASGNLLVGDDGALAAVIDFGTSGVGDPACDLVIAWTFFAGVDRQEFRRAVGAGGAGGAGSADAGMWARARGWALWKALISLADEIHRDPRGGSANRALIADLLDDAIG
jgi:aminoglycoside phosphotransferase (APT) family kinase protein